MEAAAGAIAIAKDTLRTMLANCSHFRSLGSTTWSVAEALTHIYIDAFPTPDEPQSSEYRDPWESLMPLAVITKIDSVRWSHRAGGPVRIFTVSGWLQIQLLRKRPAIDDSDPGASERSWDNIVGQIIQSGDFANPGLLELAGQASYVDIAEVRADGPFAVDASEVVTVGDSELYLIGIEWGVV